MFTLSDMSFTYLNCTISLLTLQIFIRELDMSVKRLEAQLFLIFWLVNHWKSLLLLNEVNIFLKKHSVHNIHHNALISVFLQELEYYSEIMFLMINWVKKIDDTIVSRIHLSLKYKALDSDMKTVIWESFLSKTVTDKKVACYSCKNLVFLMRKQLNDQQMRIFDQLFRCVMLMNCLLQIKNVVFTAHTLATQKKS